VADSTLFVFHLVIEETGFALAIFHRELLEAAFASLVADRAING